LSDSRSVTRQLFKLAAPIIGLNLLAVLMLAVDSALCGRLPNAEPVLEALGMAIQVIYLLMVVMLGLIVGTVALVARAFGAKAMERVSELLVQSTQLTILVGIVVGLAGAVLAGPILAALGASPEAEAIGVAYLRPMMIGTPFFYLTILYAGILRGVGNTSVPFVCALGANVVNAVLCYGFVFGRLGLPALGVEGAAVATVIAQACNALALIALLRKGIIPDLQLRLRPRRIDRKLAVELYRVGWPAALDMLIMNAGFLTAIAMLGRIDPVTVAAHGLGLRVQAIAFVPGLGVAQATGAMVGQALGAANVDRARQIARASMLLCTLVMTALAVPIFFAAGLLLAVFDVDNGTPLAVSSIEWMRILGVAMVPAAVNIALVGLLQGAGATRTSLWINCWTILLIQVPLAYVLGFVVGWEETGVWLSFPITFLARTGVLYTVYKRERWAVTGLTVSTARSGRDAGHAASAVDIA
jgi:putative MATE family efflux protein